MIDPRFPIGNLRLQAAYTPDERRTNMQLLRQAPSEFKAALSGLSTEQLDTPYREDGWTLREVAHHVPDSHMNAYIRVKLALTETQPTIKPYDEAAWARLADIPTTPIDVSLVLLEALHARWIALFESLRAEDWTRQYLHPVNGPTTIEGTLAYYVWHGQHHTAHVANLRRHRGW